MKCLFFLMCTLSLISCVQSKKQTETTTTTNKPPHKPLSPLMDSKGTLIVQPEEIAQLVQSHMNDIRGCYTTSLAKNPNSAGKVVMNWVINPEGKLLANRVAETTMDPAVGECIQGLAATWTFPPPASYRNISISYPLVFKKAKK